MWRFVQITDPHLASDRDGVWNNRFLCSMMPEVMACLRRDLEALQPEFILATGDICSHQTRDAMFEARDLMDSLAVPYYPMGGNHDFVVHDSRAWFLEAFAHRLPRPATVYSFDHRDLHFCVLDAWWLWGDGTLSEVGEKAVAEHLDVMLKDARWAIPPDQLRWIEEDLEAHANTPTLIAVHYPAVPVPKRMRRPDYRDAGSLENGAMLLELLRGFPQVRAIFSGHVHMHFIEELDGIVQVATGALPEYPTEYRDIRVFDDRIEVDTLALSDPAFAKRSLIPGREWTSGEPRDRAVVIPLD